MTEAMTGEIIFIQETTRSNNVHESSPATKTISQGVKVNKEFEDITRIIVNNSKDKIITLKENLDLQSK